LVSDQRLESLRAQLLERSDVTVARVVHNDIETPERLHRQLHRYMSRVFIHHVERRGAHLVAVLCDQIFEAPRIADGRDEAIARRQHRVRNGMTETAGAPRYQPDFRHNSPPIRLRCRLPTTPLAMTRAAPECGRPRRPQSRTDSPLPVMARFRDLFGRTFDEVPRHQDPLIERLAPREQMIYSLFLSGW